MNTYKTTEDNKKFGKRLCARMHESHITQAQLSRDLRIPYVTVTNWIAGKRLPRAGAMDALCRYLNCTREDLLSGQPKSAPEPGRMITADELELALDALDAAGCGDIKDLVRAAVRADKKSVEFVTGILERNSKKD